MKLPIVATLLALFVAGEAAAQSNAETIRIPGPGGASMIAALMRPAGNQPRPLVVINHGSPADSAQRPTMTPSQYHALSSWFLSRGYVVVLPLRRGYGQSGGTWAENYGSCRSPDYYSAGLQGAADIKATLDYMRRQPYVAPDHSIVVGHSAGGWATLALSSENPAGVSGMIDFAGGRGGHQKLPEGGTGNCESSALVSAAGRYGATARVPMLWIFAANDSFFEPRLAQRMLEAYTAAGGHATYRPQAAFGRDGHTLAGSDSGVAVWSTPVADFLAGLK